MAPLIALTMMIPLPIRLDLDLKQGGTFTATIVNESGRTLRLITPQDGSMMGWRPPFIRYSIAPDDRSRMPDPSPPTVLGCGNVDRIKESAFFTLAPGQTKTFSLPSPLNLREPGDYRIMVDYLVNSARPLQGESPEMGAVVKTKLKQLTKIQLRSVPIRVRVSADGKLTKHMP